MHGLCLMTALQITRDDIFAAIEHLYCVIPSSHVLYELLIVLLYNFYGFIFLFFFILTYFV